MNPEWAPQDGILIAWPHEGTDWAYILDDVTACYRALAHAIVESGERLLIITPEMNIPAPQSPLVTLLQLPTNDTWARDFGPIGVNTPAGVELLDFQFNGWGLKFAADCDNMVNRRLDCLKAPLRNHQDMVLEGGSIEADGNGTVLTTEQCLLSVNRNDAWDRDRITRELCERLGCRKVLWLRHGALAGDDTDGHIDTLARFAPSGTLLYTGCDDPTDEHFAELRMMEEELMAMTDADGKPYRLVRLPLPDPIADEISRLPATYANFLVLNTRVLVPTYRQERKDRQAMDAIATAFPGREVVGIDCLPLIRQHGSLHCATMQLPAGSLS